MNGYVAAVARPAGFGVIALGLLLTLYFGLLTLISGWQFSLDQFSEFWHYILALGTGFGLQVALYTRLHELLRRANDARTVMAASGTTSLTAMISCCAHYLVNVAPVLGATGLVTIATQYQIELFWVGLAFNGVGIAYISSKLWQATKEHALCVHA